jgi:ribonuclease BN (tRNA processing enzyme)
MAVLHLLGTGTPTPTTSSFGTSYVLQLDEDYLMFDCGPATTHKLVRAGLFPTQIDYLFFTHHHFDHNVDYPCFLLCRWDQSIGKERRLRVWGPSPTQWITERLVGAEGVFSLDWKARVGSPLSQRVHVNRGGTLPRPEPVVEVTDVGPGKVVEHGRWRVTAARAQHVQPWLESLAYRVDAENRSIVFAGDTVSCKPVIQLAAEADVFIVHCWDHQETMERNGEAAGIAGTLEAARMAQDAQVKTLLLTHTGSRLNKPGAREKAIRDIAAIYQGDIIFGEECMRLELW